MIYQSQNRLGRSFERVEQTRYVGSALIFVIDAVLFNRILWKGLPSGALYLTACSGEGPEPRS